MTLPGYQLLADRSCLNPDDLVMRTRITTLRRRSPRKGKKKENRKATGAIVLHLIAYI